MPAALRRARRQQFLRLAIADALARARLAYIYAELSWEGEPGSDWQKRAQSCQTAQDDIANRTIVFRCSSIGDCSFTHFVIPLRPFKVVHIFVCLFLYACLGKSFLNER